MKTEDVKATVRDLATNLLRDFSARLLTERKQRDAAEQQLRKLGVTVATAIEAIENVVPESSEADDKESNAMRIGLASAWLQLQQVGLSRDGNVGERYDPGRHRVIQDEASDSLRVDRIVVRVVEPGIIFKGERLRHATVVVRREGTSDGPNRH